MTTTDLPGMSPDQRMKHHVGQLRAIAFTDGTKGVAKYKEAHPEAAGLAVNLKSFAYRRKPKGYHDAVMALVESWLDTKTAASRTNREDVARLNQSLQSDQFNPDTYFNRPISLHLMRTIGDAFAKRGIPFAMGDCNTLSKVRQAVKAGKASALAARRIGHVGVVAGNTLTIGTTAFPLETHNDRQCVRVAVDGRRVRVRLDVLEVLMRAIPRPGKREETHHILIHSIKGETAPDAETTGETPLGGPNTEELAPLSDPVCDDPAPLSDTRPRTLGDRLQSLRDAKPSAPAEPADVDPLTL